MADRKLVRVLQQVLAEASEAGGVGDAELLERFTSQGDPAALELLVWRHQKLVLGICRRILRNEHDAEDAFQAAFLILARKAGSISKRQSVGCWLYQVATRAALAARTARLKRASREQPLGTTDLGSAAQAAALAEQRELGSMLDEEIGKLPEPFRAVILLCYFESKSVDEAAAQLGCRAGLSQAGWRGPRIDSAFNLANAALCSPRRLCQPGWVMWEYRGQWHMASSSVQGRPSSASSIPPRSDRLFPRNPSLCPRR